MDGRRPIWRGLESTEAASRIDGRFGWANQEDRAADAELDGILAAHRGMQGCEIRGVENTKGKQKIRGELACVWDEDGSAYMYLNANAATAEFHNCRVTDGELLRGDGYRDVVSCPS